jgi:hypothetical protein
MFKHECVRCLEAHNFKCVYGIRLLSIFFGVKEINNCQLYINRVNKKTKRVNKK